jgi:hypothetical protein
MFEKALRPGLRAPHFVGPPNRGPHKRVAEQRFPQGGPNDLTVANGDSIGTAAGWGGAPLK